MQLELFSFNKIEKNPKTVEERLNAFLEKNKFKFANQSESTKSGKFFISLFHEPGKSNMKAKVFKDTNHKNLQKNVNEFLESGVTMKFSCQSSTTNSIYIVIFYELRKAKGGETNEDKG